MSDIKVMVLGSGQDLIGDVISEDERFFQVKNARLLGRNPETKEMAYFVFAVHAEKSVDLVIPVNKNSLITWYSTSEKLKNSFETALTQYRSKLSGIILPGVK